MEKNIEYYLELPYTRELIPEPGGIWFVQIKELPNCMSQGNSPEEALRNIDEAMRGWIKSELEDGEEIPEPKEEEEYSGNFRLRLPKSLHRQLVQVADQQGVSLNAYCSAALAQAVGRKSSARKKESFTDMADSMERLLNACQVEIQEEQSVESQFVQWMGAEIDDIATKYREGNVEESLGALEWLSRSLKKSEKNSPLLDMVSSLLSYLSEMIKKESTRSLIAFTERREFLKAYPVEGGLVSEQQMVIENKPQSFIRDDFLRTTKRGK